MKTEAIYKSFIQNLGKKNDKSTVAFIRDRTLYINANSFRPTSGIRPNITAYAGLSSAKTQTSAYPVARFLDDNCAILWGCSSGTNFLFYNNGSWNNTTQEKAAREFAYNMDQLTSITKIQFNSIPALCKLCGPKSSLPLNELMEYTFLESGDAKVSYERTGIGGIYPPANARMQDIVAAVRLKAVQAMTRRAVEFAITDWCAAIVKYRNDVRNTLIKAAQAIEQLDPTNWSTELRGLLDDQNVSEKDKLETRRKHLNNITEILAPARAISVTDPEDRTLFFPTSGPFYNGWGFSRGEILNKPTWCSGARLQWMTVKLPGDLSLVDAWHKSSVHLQKLLDIIKVKIEDPFGIPVSDDTVDAISLFRPNAASTIFEAKYDLQSLLPENEVLELAQEFPEIAAHFSTIQIESA